MHRDPRMRHSIWLLTSLALLACGPRYRSEIVGTGHAVVSRESTADMATPSASPASGRVMLADNGLHQFDLSIDLPRALRVSYALQCAGGRRLGTVGETEAEYRRRRLAELHRAREENKRAIDAVAGAVLGKVDGATQVESADGQVRAQVQVQGEEIGEAAAEYARPQAQQPAWDIGARTIHTRVTMSVDAGICYLSLSGEDGEVTDGLNGRFVVTRLVDLKAEAHKRREAIAERARAIRGELSASLIATGAAPGLREGERAARRAKANAARAARTQTKLKLRATRLHEERARKRVQLELRAKVELERRTRVQGALHARGLVVSWLAECGGDRYRRRREELERDRRRRELVSVSLHARAQLIVRLEALGADSEYRGKRDALRLREFEARAEARASARRDAAALRDARTDGALRVRARLLAQLKASGASLRGSTDTVFEATVPEIEPIDAAAEPTATFGSTVRIVPRVRVHVPRVQVHVRKRKPKRASPPRSRTKSKRVKTRRKPATPVTRGHRKKN